MRSNEVVGVPPIWYKVNQVVGIVFPFVLTLWIQLVRTSLLSTLGFINEPPSGGSPFVESDTFTLQTGSMGTKAYGQVLRVYSQVFLVEALLLLEVRTGIVAR